MAHLSYRQPGLVLAPGSGSPGQVRDLQRDLRRLGYLRAGIDGQFGSMTTLAVQALQYDLMHNTGVSNADDGPAPVRVVDYNHGRVVSVTGGVDQNLVECISDILDDPNFPTLPCSTNPVADNQAMLASISSLHSTVAPVPFLLAILRQESGLKHYCEPQGDDQDSYIVVGLDTNGPQKYAITSRGFGAGQYTLFHHPPRPEEVSGIMQDPAANLGMAVRELRDKFDHFLVGRTRGTRTADRTAEIGSSPLRICRYASNDPRYMSDCQQCARDAGTRSVTAGVTPLYVNSRQTYQTTQYYKKTRYTGVPVRDAIGCDWPYAVRRYNGSGLNSYWYQAIVLINLLSLQKARRDAGWR